MTVNILSYIYKLKLLPYDLYKIYIKYKFIMLFIIVTQKLWKIKTYLSPWVYSAHSNYDSFNELTIMQVL